MAGVLLAAVAPAAEAGVSEALLAAALGPRRLSMAAAFEQHRLSGGHTLAAEVTADQAPDPDSTMVVIVWLPGGRRDSLAHSVGPQGRMSEGPL